MVPMVSTPDYKTRLRPSKSAGTQRSALFKEYWGIPDAANVTAPTLYLFLLPPYVQPATECHREPQSATDTDEGV